jgi:hypothetical protein
MENKQEHEEQSVTWDDLEREAKRADEMRRRDVLLIKTTTVAYLWSRRKMQPSKSILRNTLFTV